MNPILGKVGYLNSVPHLQISCDNECGIQSDKICQFYSWCR